jgi:hypothetical protein
VVANDYSLMKSDCVLKFKMNFTKNSSTTFFDMKICCET